MEVELTEVGKRWVQEHNPQGIVWDYDPDRPFKLHSVATEFVELTYLGARAATVIAKHYTSRGLERLKTIYEKAELKVS